MTPAKSRFHYRRLRYASAKTSDAPNLPEHRVLHRSLRLEGEGWPRLLWGGLENGKSPANPPT